MTLRMAGLVGAATGVLLMAGCGAGVGAGRQAGDAAARRATSSGVPASRPASVPPAGCAGFSLSLVSDRGGQPTPLAAAAWFAAHPGIDVPPPATGWREDRRDANGAVLRSGGWTLHAVQGPDMTWQVDSGQHC